MGRIHLFKRKSEHETTPSANTLPTENNVVTPKKDDIVDYLNRASDTLLLEEIRKRIKTPSLSETVFMEGTKDGILTDGNDALFNRLGFDREELIGKQSISSFFGTDEKDAEKRLQKLFQFSEFYTESESPCRTKDGKICFFSWTNRFQNKEKLLAVGTEITEKKNLEHGLKQILWKDKIIDFPNREFFKYFADLEIKKAKYLKVPLSLAVIKPAYFHDIGASERADFSDEILKKIALILQKHCFPFNLLTRWTDTIFVGLFIGLTMEQLIDKSKEIKEDLLKRSFRKEFENSFITVSFDVTELEKDEETVDSLLQKANI